MGMVEDHHRDQKLIARHLIAELDAVWGLLDFHDLEGTTGVWLRATRPIVEKAYLTSQYVAAEFVKSYRGTVLPHPDPLEVDIPNPLGAFLPNSIPDRDTQMRIMVSMKVTGPLHVAKIMPMDEADAMRRGFGRSTGAAIRIALNGGRGMVRLLADVDPHAVGIQAFVDEDACNGCLDKRGPILKSAGGAAMDVVAVGHDACRCSAFLLYS